MWLFLVLLCINIFKFERTLLVINDPKVTEDEVKSSLFNDKNQLLKNKVLFEKSISKAANKADAIIILTDWDEYKNINWEFTLIQLINF